MITRRKNFKSYLFPGLTSLLLNFIFFLNHAKAQWVLPVNNFNLMENLDQGLLNLTNWLLGFTVTVAVIALIWGGLNYLTSSGDTQKADLSKRIIYYALIGIFIAGISYAVINTAITVIMRP